MSEIRGSWEKKRGIEILRCGVKRLLSAFADKEWDWLLLFSFSTQVENRRPRPTASQFIAAFLTSAHDFQEAAA